MPRDVATELQREYDHLIAQRDDRAFVLAIATYLNAIRRFEQVRDALQQLEAEATERLRWFVGEQNRLIDEAKALRGELAVAAPEVDNSNMPEPDHASHQRARYELDSFANFDRLADADHPIGFPLVPRDDVRPGPVFTLLVILKGRLRAAQFGEDAAADAANQRPDLDALGRRIGNLETWFNHALRQYRIDARTLPGLSYTRLWRFGQELIPPPLIVEEGDEVGVYLDAALHDFLSPQRVLRMVADGDHMEDWEARQASEIITLLREEAGQLNAELLRRVPHVSGVRRIARMLGLQLWQLLLGVVVAVLATLILVYVFGIK